MVAACELSVHFDLVNQTPGFWYCKKQRMFETSIYDSKVMPTLFLQLLGSILLKFIPNFCLKRLTEYLHVF
jgi:hypothetical protein